MNTIFLYALLAGVAFIADVAGAMVTKAPKVTASVYDAVRTPSNSDDNSSIFLSKLRCHFHHTDF